MSNQEKYQNHRDDRHKPSVVKKYEFWWARVWDMNGKFHTEMAHSQAKALDKAYEFAELVAYQRMEPTA